MQASLSLLMHDHKRALLLAGGGVIDLDFVAAGFEVGDGVAGFEADFEGGGGPARFAGAFGLQEKAGAAAGDVGIEADDGAGDGVDDAELRLCLFGGDGDKVAEPVFTRGDPCGILVGQNDAAAIVVVSGGGGWWQFAFDKEFFAAETAWRGLWREAMAGAWIDAGTHDASRLRGPGGVAMLVQMQHHITEDGTCAGDAGDVLHGCVVEISHPHADGEGGSEAERPVVTKGGAGAGFGGAAEGQAKG